ncbi:MAG TPA: SDR family oxidoreductase [Albitalea sp.]|nr:SDR family oxidoreductase [Albitalea sp.]
MTPRHALVTGGTRGIGHAFARALCAEGYHVTVTGLTQEEVDACDTVPGMSARVLDVTSDESVSEIYRGMERLDALINCAGIVLRNGAEFAIDGFRKVLEVNLSGTMRMCLGAKALLARGGGCIVNTASMLSFQGGPGVPAYTASKGGVAQLTKSLAGAWAADGIRVNAIAPGWIATDLTRALVEDEARSNAILSRTPMGRWGVPDDLRGAIVFLCSPQSAFMTGVILPVDGGYLAM